MTAENSLSQTDVAGMKLTGVSVGFAPNARVDWEEGERAFAGAKAMSDAQVADARRTQEYRDYVHAMLSPRIKSGIEQAMTGRLTGSRPVRLHIEVDRFSVPTVMSRGMIGTNPEMTASARLVDARTGETIIAHPKIEAFVIVGHGIIGTAVQAAMDGAMQQSLETRVINEYGRQYRQWLIRA